MVRTKEKKRNIRKKEGKARKRREKEKNEIKSKKRQQMKEINTTIRNADTTD